MLSGDTGSSRSSRTVRGPVEREVKWHKGAGSRRAALARSRRYASRAVGIALKIEKEGE